MPSSAPPPPDPQQPLLEELERLLQTELDALVAGDIAGLPEMAERKAALCAEIEQLEQQRRQGGTQAPQRGDALRELTRAVAQANQRNGMVLAALIRNTQGALDILRGVNATAPVYGPQGQTVGDAAPPKPLASA